MSRILKHKRGLWLACVLMTSLLGALDYVTGWELGFFVFYYLPIFIAAWFLGLKPALGIAVYASINWYAADAMLEKHYSSPIFLFWNASMRLVSDLILVFVLVRIKGMYEREIRIKGELERANREIKVLKGVLPICASCKKIRNDEGYWEQIEVYISKYSYAEFSHGVCRECVSRLYPEFSDKIG